MNILDSVRVFLHQLKESFLPEQGSVAPQAPPRAGRPDVPPGSSKRRTPHPDANAGPDYQAESPKKRHRKEINQFPPAKPYAQGRHEVKTRHDDHHQGGSHGGRQRGGLSK